MDAVLDGCEPRRLAPHALAHRTGLAWARYVFRPDTGAWRSPQQAVPNGSVLGGEHTSAAQRLSIRRAMEQQ